MASSSPLASPLATMCRNIGGKCPTASSAARRLLPSLTLCTASARARFSHVFVTTSVAIFMASTSGTPLDVRIASVLAYRLALPPRASRRTKGSDSLRRSHQSRTSALDRSQRPARTPTASTPTTIHQYCCSKSLAPISTSVRSGRLWPVSANTSTMPGTT